MADADLTPPAAEGAPELDHDAIGFRGALVIGLASTAPAYSLAAVIGTVTVIVGFQAPGALLASFVPMFLIAAAFFYMNRADQDAGTTFSWVTRAAGALARVARRLGGLHDGDPRRRLARRRWCPVHVRALRVGRCGRVEDCGDGAGRHLHRRDDGDLHHRNRAHSRGAGRDDRPADRGAAALRRRRPLQGVRRQRSAGLHEARARLALAVRDLQHVDARLRAVDRRLHLLGLGERGQPHGGDA